MRSVLLLDDDPVVISLYTAMFRHHGYEVLSAADGESGLECLQRRRPDAVLLDLGMPRLDGLAWLRRVRADPQYRNLPVVILTSGALDVQIRAAQEGAAACVLSKHRSDPDEVVSWVVAAMTGNWTARSATASGS